MPFVILIRIFGKNTCLQLTRTISNSLRYEPSEVEAPPPLQYDTSLDERELTVEQWRAELWREVVNWQPHPGTVSQASTSMQN